MLRKVGGEKYRIGFRGSSPRATNFIIGICKKPDITHLDPQKLTKLNEKYGPGKNENWWTWYQSVHEHYRNWDEKVLMMMYKKDEKAITYFRDYILGIKEIAEPVIDEAVRSK